MATASRARRIRNRVDMSSVTPPPTPVDPLDAVKAKFTRLSELQTSIAAAKLLYSEYDQLLEELVPCFVTKTETGFVIKSQITIGDKVYRLHPSFFDVTKNKVVAKKWKSAAFPTMMIEG